MWQTERHNWTQKSQKLKRQETESKQTDRPDPALEGQTGIMNVEKTQKIKNGSRK